VSLLTGRCMVFVCQVLASEPANRRCMVFVCRVLTSEPANRVVYTVWYYLVGC
jgi:hypothetical protein